MILLQKGLDYYLRDFQNVYVHLIQNISEANEQNMSSRKYFSINCTAEESCKKFFVTGPQIYIVRQYWQAVVHVCRIKCLTCIYSTKKSFLLAQMRSLLTSFKKVLRLMTYVQRLLKA